MQRGLVAAALLGRWAPTAAEWCSEHLSRLWLAGSSGGVFIYDIHVEPPWVAWGLLLPLALAVGALQACVNRGYLSAPWAPLVAFPAFVAVLCALLGKDLGSGEGTLLMPLSLALVATALVAVYWYVGLTARRVTLRATD